MRRWFLHGRVRQGEDEQGQVGRRPGSSDAGRRFAYLARWQRADDSANASANQGPGSVAATCVALLVALGACEEPAALPPPRTPAVRVKAPAAELTTVELARRTLRSVVTIQTPEGTGSGFFVAPDLVATCFHVVRGNSDIKIKAVGWSGRAASVAAWDEENDLAVLRVTPAADARGLKIDRGPYVVGSKVVVVSSPLGLDDTVSEGIVSALRREPEDRLQFTAPISPGSSGGPIVNTKGEVTGMVASFRAKLERGVTIGQNLNFAVPASRIMIAMATPNDLSLAAFAAQTIPAEEKKWREIEANLSSLDSDLVEELGARVGTHFGRAIREAVADRDGERAKRLIDRENELKGLRKNLMEQVQNLHRLGDQGPQLAAALVSAWEDWAVAPDDETRSRFLSVSERGSAFAREVLQRLQRPSLPDRFAGFPFMGSYAVISEYCWGYQQEAGPGMWALQCPNVPVTPPFAFGGASLSFLNGALVTVQMDVRSYEEAVRVITAKYGEPSPGSFVKGHWVDSKPSYGTNTAFDWTLNGGRIRVGRTTGKPFVAFIREERDRAIDSSF